MDKRILAWAVAAAIAGGQETQAQSAGVVSLSVSPTSGTGSITPRLTWSTNPVATSCRASGGWSGTKAASGNQTLSAVNANTSYTLTCTWGSGSARVSWNAPTTNTDGTPLTSLSGFKVVYGTSNTALTQSLAVNNPATRSATIDALAPGTWFFAVRAVNTSNAESDNSNVASKSVTGATAARTVSVTVTSPTPVPSPPPPAPAPPPPPPPPSGTLRTTSVDVYDVLQQSNGTWSPRAIVGTTTLGKTCSTAFTANGGYYQVGVMPNSISGITLNSTRPWSNILVARCASS